MATRYFRFRRQLLPSAGLYESEKVGRETSIRTKILNICRLTFNCVTVNTLRILSVGFKNKEYVVEAFTVVHS